MYYSVHTTQRPDWQQREAPTFQITDLSGGVYNDAVALHSQTEAANPTDVADFIEWVNEYRTPLHTALRQGRPMGQKSLTERHIRLREVNNAVAVLVGAPLYPLRRILRADIVDVLPVCRQALTAVTPGLQLEEGDDIQAQYNPLLNLVVVDSGHIQETTRTSLVDMTAAGFGQAALSSIVDISMSPNGSTFRYGYGYQWRQNGEAYGGMLQKAAAKKIAALVRKQLGIVLSGKPEDDPILEPYRKSEGYYYEDGMAIALDLISQSAGMRSDTPGVFKYVWEFAKSGRQAAPREELALIVKRATNNGLTLEDLEATPIASKGMPLTLLSKVEEACGIEASKRPSSVFKRRGVVSAD